MALPEMASREEWRAARIALLADEKELTHHRDAVNTKRRSLPMVEVTEPYVFEGPDGRADLRGLFEGRRQLIVHHAMWLDDAHRICPSCSGLLDQIGYLAHLHVRSTTFCSVSRGPWAEIAAFRERMGWRFPCWSSAGSRFNVDFHVTLDESAAPIEYNFLSREALEDKGFRVGDTPQPFDLPGISTFLQHDGRVFHTYSTYARGLDNLGFVNDLLDLTALGRQEAWEEPKGRAQAAGGGAGDPAVRYHDEYPADIGVIVHA
jgi:predicted dithiol-disulfide oxidoreductase (DUF899 family)